MVHSLQGMLVISESFKEWHNSLLYSLEYHMQFRFPTCVLLPKVMTGMVTDEMILNDHFNV